MENAIDHLKKAIEIDPDYTDARNYLVSAENYRKIQNDIDVLEKELEKKPYDADILHKLAVLYSYLGDNLKARSMLFKLRDLHPDDPDVYYNIHPDHQDGVKDWNLLRRDKDLDNLRNTLNYKNWIKSIPGS